MPQPANNLRAIRERKGLTQRQVADALGFASTNRISKWEHGIMYPHVLNFLRLLDLYGVDAGDVYTEHSRARDETRTESTVLTLTTSMR